MRLIDVNQVISEIKSHNNNFCEAYITAMNDMARMVVDDQKDDKEFVYAKAKIDEQIKSIVGPENFKPWEVRYGNIQK